MVETKSLRGGWGGTITADAHVRRQIKAGRKPKTRTLPSLFEAVERLCDEADRGQSLMAKYGLEPEDIHVALIFRQPGGQIDKRTLPPPENIGAFITEFEQMGGVTPLGILWWQTTPETRDRLDRSVTMWITEFADDKRAALEMLIYRNALASLPAPQ